MTTLGSGWACVECGHRFKTLQAAMRAVTGDRGCPRCGGSDIDLANGATTVRCPDCGERGERKGHQTCQYPQN